MRSCIKGQSMRKAEKHSATAPATLGLLGWDCGREEGQPRRSASLTSLGWQRRGTQWPTHLCCASLPVNILCPQKKKSEFFARAFDGFLRLL